MRIQVEADAIDQVLTGCESTELTILETGAAATATATPTPTSEDSATPTPTGDVDALARLGQDIPRPWPETVTQTPVYRTVL